MERRPAARPSRTSSGPCSPDGSSCSTIDRIGERLGARPRCCRCTRRAYAATLAIGGSPVDPFNPDDFDPNALGPDGLPVNDPSRQPPPQQQPPLADSPGAIVVGDGVDAAVDGIDAVADGGVIGGI